jgi:hypothetical protein
MEILDRRIYNINDDEKKEVYLEDKSKKGFKQLQNFIKLEQVEAQPDGILIYTEEGPKSIKTPSYMLPLALHYGGGMDDFQYCEKIYLKYFSFEKSCLQYIEKIENFHTMINSMKRPIFMWDKPLRVGNTRNYNKFLILLDMGIDFGIVNGFSKEDMEVFSRLEHYSQSSLCITTCSFTGTHFTGVRFDNKPPNSTLLFEAKKTEKKRMNESDNSEEHRSKISKKIVPKSTQKAKKEEGPKKTKKPVKKTSPIKVKKESSTRRPTRIYT